MQSFLTSDHALLSEVGDSWFNTQKMKLPDGCGCERQSKEVGDGALALEGHRTDICLRCTERQIA